MKGLILIFLSVLLSQAALGRPIFCKVERLNKQFIIEDGLVEVVDLEAGRSIASLSTRAALKIDSIEKNFAMDNAKYSLKYSDKLEFSEVSDSISITNSENHEITYPMVCR